MSRHPESMRKFIKTGNCIVNITIGSEKKMSSIVDSMKGIENIEIDAKELKPNVYDFIVNFGTKDYDGVFHEKFGELLEILNKDFPGYEDLGTQKYSAKLLSGGIRLQSEMAGINAPYRKV